ncbi:LysE family translocator [Neptunitalea lumnitzerae]|uniref:Lysine transporter LysE n=1 Tax=Neptunitalea lumnitzerae TaxID=2965509 RepID=A0ABQ5MFT1_9FLAO|nr:LysE family transporter [Neptunitalea sp. Y10]GLB48176.1 lysine transporter LysE [Neptunitalea sp. Y10]
MLQDVFAAIPLGWLLAFTIGPIFFLVIETSVSKGFRAAMTLDLGAATGDVFFILVAYFSTSKLLERIKDDPFLFIFGGLIMMCYGVFSYIKEKRDYNKKLDEEYEVGDLPRSNYLAFFFKGFLLNFINIGVLGFWLVIILSFGPKLDMQPNRILIFFATIIITYLVTDAIKIILAKQLKNKLTPSLIHKLKRIISVIIVVCGCFLMFQGIFPNEKKYLEKKLEFHQGTKEDVQPELREAE